MASEITNSLVRVQLAGRLDGTKKVSSAQGEGTDLMHQKQMDQVAQKKVEQTGSTTNNKIELNDAVAEINQFVQSIQRELQFTVTDDVTVIEVRDTHTNELVRKIPSDDAIKLAQNLQEAAGSNVSIFNVKV